MYRFTDEDYIEAAKRATSKADMLRLLGRKVSGGAYWTVSKRIKELNIDVSHFTDKKSPDFYKHPRKSKPVEYYLVKKDPNLPYTNTDIIKRLLLKTHLKEYKCECCGLSEWNGQPIPLQLHHMNGDRSDNRLENIQLLCPNCHFQTDNWGSHNKPKKDITSPNWDEVDKKLKEEREYNNFSISEHKKENSEGIKHSHNKTNNEPKLRRNKSVSPTKKEMEVHMKARKCERPSKEELNKLIYEKPFVQIAKMYGVCDKSIAKWCKWYGLPYRKKDIKSAGDGTVDVTGREPVEV